MMRWLFILLVCSSLTSSSACAAADPHRPKVNVVQAPVNSLVPDVVLDSTGVLHMVYGLEHHAYYIRSKNNGTTFTPPVKVNATGMVETKMGERGPNLAVGKDGVVHVVWMDEWAPGVKTYVRYSRSVDGGRSFEPVNALSSMSGIDGVTVAADNQGNVVSFWHVMTDPKPEVECSVMPTCWRMCQAQDTGIDDFDGPCLFFERPFSSLYTSNVVIFIPKPNGSVVALCCVSRGFWQG